MAIRRPKLGTRSRVLKELEQSYASLLDGTNPWDMTDKDLYALRLRTLEIALKAADDSDTLEQLQALKERVDAIAKPRQITSAGRHLRDAG